MRVLICDDNVDAATTLAYLFSANRHEVWSCHDGASCLAKARTWQPDVVLLDIGMPAANGYEVAAALRAMEFGERVFIIAISGWGSEQDRTRSSAAGIDLHVTKPADFPALLAAVAGGRKQA